jgi:hypothetical protein
MATVACPGCGMPRTEDQIGSMPCPLCHAASTPPAAKRLQSKSAEYDPTAGLPSDVSELASHTPAKRQSASLWWSSIVASFVLGTAAGIGGVVGWQSLFQSDRQEGEKPIQERITNSVPTTRLQDSISFEMAPMPRLVLPPDSSNTSQASPLPVPKLNPVPPANAILIDIHQPEATYTLPISMKHGEYVVLRGKVKTLRVDGVEGGATLDASGLEAGSIYISGHVDESSTLSLNAPNGAVSIIAPITANSRVEINAAGGGVRFLTPFRTDVPRSQIDGGSIVTINARTIELGGGVGGEETRVEAIVAPEGILSVSAIRGTATVEYWVGPGVGDAPTVTAKHVGPKAAFRRKN